MPYVGQKPADIISTAVDTVTGKFSGEIDAASLDISGNIDVDGTTNLDIVDIDGAVDMATTLQVDGAITSSAGATLTTADNTAQLTLVSTDADAAVGPYLNLYRNSGSPADSDLAGIIEFTSRNDNSEDFIVASLDASVIDVSNGTEDDRFRIKTMTGGSLKAVSFVGGNMTIGDGQTVNFGNAADLTIGHDGSNSIIKDAGTGNLFLDSVAGSVIIRVNTDENAIEAIGDGAVNISHNGSTKIATASGGVNVTGGIGLGGTGAANILNDYEEGTFTPTFKNSGGVEVDAYSIQTGFYTKVGRLVHVRGFVVVNGISNLGSSNPIFLGGLPFDSENLTNGHSVGTFNYGQGLNITAGHVVAGHLGNNTTNVNLTVWNVSTGVGDFTFGLLSGDGGIMFSIHYHVA